LNHPIIKTKFFEFDLSEPPPNKDIKILKTAWLIIAWWYKNRDLSVGSIQNPKSY